MNLLLVERDELVGDRRDVELRDARARHLIDVLHVVRDQQVRVGIIDGPLGTGTVIAIDGERVRLRCTFGEAMPAVPAVDLLLALPRPKVMRRLWAQLAAIGVGRIILTNAERVERDYFGAHVLTPSVYGPLLLEGLQQARDTRVPLVSVHRRFRVLIEDELDALSADSLRLVAHPAEQTTAREAIRPTDTTRALVAVGPEGGWNRFELELLEAHGFRPIGMGARTLRTDTACVALLSLVHDALRSLVVGGRSVGASRVDAGICAWRVGSR
jgi:RsmE family RNA methyltransferase